MEMCVNEYRNIITETLFLPIPTCTSHTARVSQKHIKEKKQYCNVALEPLGILMWYMNLNLNKSKADLDR